MMRFLTPASGRRSSSAIAAAVLAGGSLVAGAGCQSSLYDENRAMHTQNKQLQNALTEKHQELQVRPTKEQFEAQKAAYDQALAQRDQLIADLQNKLNAPQADGTKVEGIEGVEVDFDADKGEMTMRVPGDVVFASGSTGINKGAEATLGRIADVLKSEYDGKAVRVEGHTDTDPISKTKKLYADNRDLSLKRAYSVTQFLENKGVTPSRIETVGHGEYKPRGEVKKDNRRVEIVVVL